jgi:hypothetical protein
LRFLADCWAAKFGRICIVQARASAGAAAGGGAAISSG